MIDRDQIFLMGLIMMAAFGVAITGWFDERREAKEVEQEKAARKNLEKKAKAREKSKEGNG